MGRRRLWLSMTAGMLILLLALGGYAAYQLQRTLHAQGIHLDWQAMSLSVRGVQFAQFDLQRSTDSGLVHLRGAQVQLDWLASESPRYRLLMQDVQVLWQPASPDATQTPQADLQGSLQQLRNVLPWLPRRIEVAALQATLPCASGSCTLQGDLQLQRVADRLQIDAKLQRDAHEAGMQLALGGLDAFPDSPLNLKATLALDGQQELTLQSELAPLAEGTDWRGQLSMPQLGDVTWFADWIAEWLLADASPLPLTPQRARLDAHWQLRLGTEGWNLQTLLAAPGELRLDALLEQPWPVPGLGLVAGQLALDLHGDAGQWQARQLSGDLTVDSQGAPWLAPLPADLQPGVMQVQIRPATTTGDSTALALDVSLNTSGPLQVQAHTELALTQRAAWELDLRQLTLSMRSPHLRVAQGKASGLALQLTASGRASPNHLDLSLAPGSALSIAQLDMAGIALQQLRAELGGLKVQDAKLQGPFNLQARRLQHARLQDQGWRLQGTLLADTAQQTLDADLHGDAGLELPLQLQRTSDGAIELDASLPELFLRAGNPLAQTLADWPQLLSLDNGRLQGSARLRMPAGRPLNLQLTLNAKGLAGIYDRSTFSGVEGDLHLKVANQQLEVQVPGLSAARIDPGIALGPARLQASYKAPLSSPMTGRLRHERMQLGVLGGTLSLPAAELDLQQPSQLLPLQLAGLDLQELFRVYPAEGLQGSGLIDGTLPVRLGEGLSIEQGLIQARAPGGQLSFHSPRIRAMGQANPGMKLVTDALENFHYDLLSSSLDYDPSGTLRLGMRLQGSNPDIEGGRAIHFNINLEEDIPSLLASLQLTDKVSEIIRKRIQQRMRPRIPQDAKE